MVGAPLANLATWYGRRLGEKLEAVPGVALGIPRGREKIGNALGSVLGAPLGMDLGTPLTWQQAWSSTIRGGSNW